MSGVTVTGTRHSAQFQGLQVLFYNDTIIAHESRGGELTSVWAGDLGDAYVEVVHLGDGPAGGELIMTVPGDNTVLLGGLYTEQIPTHVPESWPQVIDLAIGLMTADSTVITDAGIVDKDQIEAFHQQLLGAIHG